MATRDYEGKKSAMNRVIFVVDSLAIEEPLQININNKPFTVTMRTPGDDISLIRGLLHSEGVLKDVNYLPEIFEKITSTSNILTVAELSIPDTELGLGYTNSRSLLSVSSCGICGRTELGDISFTGKLADGKQMNIHLLKEAFQKMDKLQSDFHQSGGTHAAATFNNQGEMLSSAEDIGRHNAVDKAIGKLILSKRLDTASCITISGRVSYEIVIKCFKAGIPFLAAVSAPTSLAVDYAKELGITLFAFCRDNKATCYANAHRAEFLNQNCSN